MFDPFVPQDSHRLKKRFFFSKFYFIKQFYRQRLAASSINTYISMYLSFQHPSVYLSIYLSTSLYLSIYLSIFQHPAIYLSNLSRKCNGNVPECCKNSEGYSDRIPSQTLDSKTENWHYQGCNGGRSSRGIIFF